MEPLSSIYTVQDPAREWNGSSHSGNQVIPLTEAPKPISQVTLMSIKSTVNTNNQSH